MMTKMTKTLIEKTEQAQENLDAHVRDIVQWHFDEKTGCDFWLNFARTLDFDPKKEIGSYEDLKIMGHFKDEWLRGGPLRRWVPKELGDQPLSIFETGGSTGVPKSRINIKDYQTDYELFSETLSDESFPPGSDWLMLGPTGPRRLRLSIEHLAQHRGGVCFFVDLDPRWVNVLIKNKKFSELELYKNHIIEQALKILKSHDNIKCLFTTPKLLESLSEKISVPKYGITGIFCGGTEMNAQFHRFAREELVPGVDFIPTYGNTLMGLAACKPFKNSNDYNITYYPPHPRSIFELVDPSDPEKTVDYGQTGRVMLTTLTKEFFMPRFLERDEGERAEPINEYPWDGVENLRLFSQFNKSVVVGVY
jgi:phenylacetate-coenzyme A ligase PaaK-like adenylate-forming protein